MRDLSLSRSQLLLLAGTANRPLAEEMAQHLGQPLCAVTMRRFADGEIFVKIDENVRGRDVFIIQPTNPPAENYMELLLLMDAARRASAARITAVLPYFGYARQDRKDQPPGPTRCRQWPFLPTTCKASSSFRSLPCARRRCWWATNGPSSCARRSSWRR